MAVSALVTRLKGRTADAERRECTSARYVPAACADRVI